MIDLKSRGLRSLALGLICAIVCQQAHASSPALGSPKVATFQVNAPNEQTDYIGASVASDAAGNLTVVWAESATDVDGDGLEIIYARRFAVDGHPLTPQFLVHSEPGGYFHSPAVAVSRQSGDFVVSWTGNVEFAVSNTYVRLFDHNGNPKGPEIQVSTADEFSRNSFVAMNRSGNFVVGWTTQANGQGQAPFHAYLAGFNSQGQPIGSTVRLAAMYPDGSPEIGGVGIADDGHFMANFTRLDERYSGLEYLNCFDAQGTALGGDVLASQAANNSINFYSVAAQGSDGTIALATEAGRPNSANNNSFRNIYMKIFDESCQAKGTETLATPDDGLASQVPPKTITVDSETGQIVLGWQANYGDAQTGFARLLSISGFPLVDPIKLYYTTKQPYVDSIAATFDGQGNPWVAFGRFVDSTVFDDIFAASYYGAPSSIGPIIGLSSSTLEFGVQRTGTMSAVRSVSVTNRGTTPLTLKSPSLTGAGSSAFLISSNGCQASILPGQPCLISIAFRPSLVGPVAATLLIPSNAPTSPSSVSLTGSGAPLPTLSLQAQPLSLIVGAPTSLSWSTQNTSACVASGDWSGSEALNGSATIIESVAGTYHFTLTCSGPGGSVAQTAAVSWKLPTVSFASSAEQTARNPSLSGQTSTNIVVQLSDSVPSDVTVPLTYSGTEPASRYSVSPSSTVVIPAHTTSVSVNVKTTFPEYLQCDKTVILKLGAPQGATLGGVTANTLTVHNYSPVLSCAGQ